MADNNSSSDPPRLASMLKITKIQNNGKRRVLLARQATIERARHASWARKKNPNASGKDISRGLKIILENKLKKSRTSGRSRKLVKDALKRMIEEEASESDGDGSELEEGVSKSLEEEQEEEDMCSN